MTSTIMAQEAAEAPARIREQLAANRDIIASNVAQIQTTGAKNMSIWLAVVLPTMLVYLPNI